MISSRKLKEVTSEDWETIRHHALRNNPFPLIFEKCPYLTVHIADDCLFAIVPTHHHNFLELRLCIIPKPKKQPKEPDKDFWDKMEEEAWKLINLEIRDINH